MRALTRQSGARDFQFDIDTGLGSFLPAEDKPVDLSEIRESVTESGFELLWLEADVRGILGSAPNAQGDPHPAVRVEETGQVFCSRRGPRSRSARATIASDSGLRGMAGRS